MRKETKIEIIDERGKLPTLHVNKDGVRIGEDRTEGSYEDACRYVAPFIPWCDFQDFVAMVTEAKTYFGRLED